MPPETRHEVTLHHVRGHRWWQCTCGWQGESYVYDNPRRPAEALRHAIEGNRDAGVPR